MRSDDDEPGVTIELPRFGSCCYRESDVLTFPWGLPGFNGLRRFIPLELDDDGCIWLQSLDDVAVAIPTADAAHRVPGYAPRLPAYAEESLDLHDGSERVFLLVDGTSAEFEPAAPIVVNLRTRTARQIVLENRPRRVEPAPPVAAAGG